MSYLISENSPTTLTVTATAQVEVDVTGEFAAMTGAFAQTPEFFLDMNLVGHSVTNTGTINTADVIFSLRSTELNGFTMGLVSAATPDNAPLIRADVTPAPAAQSKPEDNDFTAQVPRPQFAVGMAAVDGAEFSVTFVEASLDDMKAYVKELEARGFSGEAMEMGGIYSFEATNQAGYTVGIFSMNGQSGMGITKP